MCDLPHNAHFRDKRCQKRRQRVPKTAPLAPRRPRDCGPLFLGLCQEIWCPPTLSLTTFAGPKYRKPKMASHDLRARSFEDGCLCSMLHGPLQLQIRTAFLLPTHLFPTAARQSATQLSHTAFSQLSEPIEHAPRTLYALSRSIPNLILDWDLWNCSLWQSLRFHLPRTFRSLLHALPTSFPQRRAVSRSQSNRSGSSADHTWAPVWLAPRLSADGLKYQQPRTVSNSLSNDGPVRPCMF